MRFVIISDTHYYIDGNGKGNILWNRPLTAEMDDIARDMTKCIHQAKPDFVVHCGDFIDRSHPGNEYYAWGIVKGLDCPVYLVAGNHDSLDQHAKNRISAYYHLPDGQCYYSRLIGEYLFIFLDTCCWLKKDGTVMNHRDPDAYAAGLFRGMTIPDREISWLESELEANKDRNVILVSHAPLASKTRYSVATLPNGSPGDPAGTDLAGFMDSLGVGLCNIEKTMEAVRKHGNVKMVFSGHWHIHDVFAEDGITFVQTASMREYPYEYRIIEENGGIFSVQTLGLDDGRFAEKSYCPDRGNDWVAGTAKDRKFNLAV